jgi:polysaccharide biosynthesis transport protein
MLNTFIPNRALPDPPPWSGMNRAPFQWLPSGIAFIRRRLRLIMGCSILGVIFSVVYLALTTSQYTAVATLNIDSGRANPVGGQPAITDWQSQSAYVDSQVALIESPATLRGVVTQLDMDHNPQFVPAGTGLLQRLIASVKNWLPGHETRPSGLSPTALSQAKAGAALSHMLYVWRVGATSVVEVRLRTPDPVLSAELANAVTQAYMAQQLRAVSDTTEQAGNWLQSRIGELSGQALSADRAVQEYKARNNIVDVTAGAGTGLMDEQQLGELNVELANARARVATSQARYEQAQTNTASGPNNGMGTDTIPNPVMAGLQQEYLDAVREETNLASRLGPTHGAVILQHKVVMELRQSIQSEMARQTASYRADYAAATADQNSIQAQLTDEIAAEARTNIELSELRSLQSSADAYREIYENFLQRFTQAMQDQSYPISNAHVVAAALPPMDRSYPSSTITLAIGLMLGLALGMAIAVVQEALDVSVRTVAQLRSITGLDYLGAVPESSTLMYNQNRHWSRTFRTGGQHHGRMNVPTTFREAALSPASSIADAVQSVRFAAARQSARGRDVCVIGCVSVASHEGCSTFAANLAFALAADGRRTVLVDWNTKSPWLTKTLFPGSHVGLQELIAGKATLAEVAESDPQTRLSFIGQSIGGTAGVQPGPAKVQAILAELRSTYDVIVLDLPPMQTGNTAVQLSEWVDGFVLIARWGTTPQAVLADTLARPSSANVMFLGVVLNHYDPVRMQLYAGDSTQPTVSYAPLPVEASI